MWQKAIRSTGIGAGLLTAIYLGVLMYFHMGSPQPSEDFLIAFNRDIANTPEEDKAWSTYRPLWTKYGFSEGGKFHVEEMYHETPDGKKRLVRAGDPGWEKAIQTMDGINDLLDAFREGAKLPALGIELQAVATKYSDEDFAAIMPHAKKSDYTPGLGIAGWNGEMDTLMNGTLVGALLPHVQSFRKAARMFVVDTRIAVDKSDPERALENIQTIFGLAPQAAEGNCMVCGFVGFAMTNIGFDLLEEVLAEDPEFFNEQQLGQLKNQIAELNFREWMHLEGEELMINDLIQRIYTDDGNGDGRMTPQGMTVMSDFVEGLYGMEPLGQQSAGMFGKFGKDIAQIVAPVTAPLRMFGAASRKEVTEKCSELFARFGEDLDRPFWEAELFDFDKWVDENANEFWILNATLPAGSARDVLYRGNGRRAGIITALAMHRYFAKNGEWPTEYRQLDSEFENEFPRDQITGDRLKFLIRDDKPIVYSVGFDLDDDGGEEHGVMSSEGFLGRKRGHFNFDHSENYEGDWIVWPNREEVDFE